MINNRQAGRRRGRGGQQQRSQGGSPGRPDNGNRIDNRARGNAAQLLEKYKTLARDAQMQGDRVNVEYYLQFADHYFRVLAETRARFEENGGQSQGKRPQGATLDEDEQDYEDEGDRAAPHDRPAPHDQRPDNGYRGQDVAPDGRGGNPQYNGDGNGNAHANGNGTQSQRDDRARDDRGSREERGERSNRANGNKGGQSGGEYRESQQPRPRHDGQRQDGQRQDGQRQDGQRQDGQRQDPRRDAAREAPRDDRPRDVRPEQFEPRAEPRAEPRPEPRPEQVVQAGPAPVEQDAPAEPVKRGRGRPRRVPIEAEAAGTALLDAERLPPSLGLSAVVADDAADGPADDRPRRRRGRPPAAAAVE